MTRKFSFYLLLAIVLVTGFVFFQVMANFVIPLFLAAVLVVIFRPVQSWITERCRDRARLAAALTTVAIMLIVIAPLVWIFALATSEGIHLATETPLAKVKTKVEDVRQKYNLDLENGELLHQIDDWLERSSQAIEQEGVEGPLAVVEESQLDQLRKLVGQLSTVPTDEKSAQSTAEKTANQAKRALLQSTKEQLLGAIEKLSPAKASELNFRQYSETILEFQLAFQKYRHQFLGGPLNAWIKETVNPSEEQYRELQRWLFREAKRMLLSITGTGAAIVSSLIFNLTIMILAVYYFLADGPKLIRAGMRLSPLDDRYEAELLQEFDTSCRAVVLATLLTAIVQGLLAGIGYYLCGLESVFLLTMLTMVMALVPFVGAATIWVPACLWLFIDGNPYQSVFLLVYGFLIVSMADNVVKPYVLHGQSKLHPLLALLSVIGGVQVLGPLGILVGPMLVTFLQALLNMLHGELDSLAETEVAD
ncbi:MAG: hypothetical protein CMJ81_14105 [Planctomycetaceae bacterium]|nr:hypothetical protein [Planctomycetaceae bacterium]MBP61539.1 hypothetical protein [Planctomycetaceae bacterium]